MFTAGFSKICISPPPGSPLAGFAAREGVSRGTHDDLYVRALVLANARTALALVSVEVLALPSEFIARARRAVAARTGLAPECVMIASTHTHAGPVTIKTFFNPVETLDGAYMEHLAGTVEACVAAAWRAQFPARVGVGAGRVAGIGVNRRSPDRLPVDEEVGIIRVDDAGGRARAVLFNYACHPTVLGPDNLLVTGDFPAFAIERVEAALGGGGFAMFVNGTQGNISMGHSSELSAIGVITQGRTFERAAELGRQLGEATLTALPGVATHPGPALAARCLPLDLPLKPLPPVEQAARALREAEDRLAALEAGAAPGAAVNRAKSERLYASITHFYARETQALADGRLRIEVQGLRIGDAAFVAVPAEVFVEIGMELKRRAPRRTFIIGIANGYIGYLPTREAHAAGGYEVVSAQVGPESADRLIAGALSLAGRLFAAEPGA